MEAVENQSERTLYNVILELHTIMKSDANLDFDNVFLEVTEKLSREDADKALTLIRMALIEELEKSFVYGDSKELPVGILNMHLKS